jgi:formylmethanofuran dehydrogenase subunit E
MLWWVDDDMTGCPHSWRVRGVDLSLDVGATVEEECEKCGEVRLDQAGF